MLYRAEAVVLRGKEFGECDRILTLYSREHGKIRAIAKGARRLQSSLGPATQTFTYVVFSLAVGRSLDVVRQARVKEPWAAIRADIGRMGYASVVAELVDLVTPEGEPNPELFDLLLLALYGISQIDPRLALFSFLANFLDLLGWGPALEGCAKCEARLRDGESIRFSPAAGGALCPECKEEDAFPLGGEAWAIMRALRGAELSFLSRLKPTERALERMERAYFELLQRHAEVVPKSLKIVRGLRKGREEIRRR